MTGGGDLKEKKQTNRRTNEVGILFPKSFILHYSTVINVDRCLSLYCTPERHKRMRKGGKATLSAKWTCVESRFANLPQVIQFGKSDLRKE